MALANVTEAKAALIAARGVLADALERPLGVTGGGKDVNHPQIGHAEILRSSIVVNDADGQALLDALV